MRPQQDLLRQLLRGVALQPQKVSVHSTGIFSTVHVMQGLKSATRVW
jgi:hypothetical protein